MRLDRWFDYESGHTWCESAYKYQIISIVAEFANTITNLPLIMLPLVNVLLIRPYVESVNWMVIIPHILLTVNGIASTYYHATLNLFGQLVDEISILWLLMTCLAVYFPVFSFYPKQYHKYIGRVRCVIAALTILVSTFCFVKPSLNALVLMLWSIPSVAIIHHEAANAGIPEIISFPRKISILWIAASICWVSDRAFCDFWLLLEVPGGQSWTLGLKRVKERKRALGKNGIDSKDGQPSLRGAKGSASEMGKIGSKGKETSQECGPKGRNGSSKNYGPRGKSGRNGKSLDESAGPRGTPDSAGKLGTRGSARPAGTGSEPSESGNCQHYPKPRLPN
ncbi:unnamed protein product [Acanthocheilonema viteae]|uniref:Alkaline ceramidase n=1 Tax=Acanthocheilonema viteae TaxID=6277 RepID=A0A498SED5_ACAVI|nr:unnamed protein product [Acanthocheilonema viteae]